MQLWKSVNIHLTSKLTLTAVLYWKDEGSLSTMDDDIEETDLA